MLKLTVTSIIVFWSATVGDASAAGHSSSYSSTTSNTEATVASTLKKT